MADCNSGVQGFIGFAVGRTSFWEPLIDLRANRITRDEAVDAIARHYAEFVDIFDMTARASSGAYENNSGEDSRYANGDGGTGTNGRQHGAEAAPGRT